MEGNTDTARQAAQEIVEGRRNELRRELTNEGLYHVIVEGGYHTQVLTDQEADFLCQQILVGGLDQLEEYAAGLAVSE